MHPVECNTVGLYKTPVAILDFASLYPSLYRAHNLCYTTLLHPDDVEGLPPEQTTPVLRPKANVKSHFVKPGLRRGILPSILAALIEARATTRAALKEASDPGNLAFGSVCLFCVSVSWDLILAGHVHLHLGACGLGQVYSLRSLCCAVLCYAVLCCAMLCYAVLCWAMLCYA